MIELSDELLIARFAAIANPVDDADWEGVLARVEKRSSERAVFAALRRHRRLSFAFAIMLLLIALAAPAFAFRSEIIDWITAKQAPRSVVVEFGQLDVMSRPYAALDLLPRQARRVTSVKIGRATSVLYIAPTKGGGFCALWSTSTPQCLASSQRSHGVLGSFGYTSMYPALGVDDVEGIVLARDAEVTLHYADGTSTEVPYVWVTKPIDAGFFLYGIPDDMRLGNRRPVALTVTRNGTVVARHRIENVSATTRLVNHRDRWGRSIQTTPEAIWSKRKLLFSFNASDGRLITLWSMPSRKGSSRRCYASNFATGCEAALAARSAVQLQLAGPGLIGSVLLTGEVNTDVTAVELSFEDGTSERITTKHGFVLTEIPAAHYRQGHRLVRAIAIDPSGRILGRQEFDPKSPGLYPCKRPKDFGYGVLRCP